MISAIPPTKQLTPRQLQLLRTIATRTAKQCYSPTISELAQQLNISRSTVFEHIDQLKRKGLLYSEPGRARSLTPTAKARKLLRKTPHQTEPLCSADGIPLLGRIAAGLPIEAIEDKEILSLSSHFGSARNIFALEVTGDSMVDDGICDGDYVICRSASRAENSQLVVALVDDENATLKRFYNERTHARLQPANANYPPIYSDRCKIQAIVIGLVRKL